MLDYTRPRSWRTATPVDADRALLHKRAPRCLRDDECRSRHAGRRRSRKSPNSRPRPTRGARRKRERTRIRALGVRADLNGGDLRGDETRPIAEQICRRRLAPAHYCLAGGRRILATVTRRRRLSLPTDRPHISTAQLAERAARARTVVASSDPFWPAQLAALAALLLYLLLPQKLTLGPAWLLPSVEALLLAGLVITAPSRHRPYSPRRRTFALGLIGLVTTVNFVSLGLLTHT